MGGRQPFEQGDMVFNHFDDLRHAHAEDNLAPGGRHRVVEVHDDLPGACDGAHRFADQVFAQLGHDHWGDVGGNLLLVDELAHDVEIRPRGGWKADFYFLEADTYQLMKQAQLALAVHRLKQRLVAVTQIGRQPDRGSCHGA